MKTLRRKYNAVWERGAWYTFWFIYVTFSIPFNLVLFVITLDTFSLLALVAALIIFFWLWTTVERPKKNYKRYY